MTTIYETADFDSQIVARQYVRAMSWRGVCGFRIFDVNSDGYTIRERDTQAIEPEIAALALARKDYAFSSVEISKENWL